LISLNDILSNYTISYNDIDVNAFYTKTTPNDC